MAAKNWKHGLQGRIADLETKVQDIEDGSVDLDTIATKALTVEDAAAGAGDVLATIADVVLKKGGTIEGDLVGDVTGNADTATTAASAASADNALALTGHVTDSNFVTPVNAVLATGGKLAYQDATLPTAGKIVTIPAPGQPADFVYKFVAAVADPGDVKIGASADATMLNLARAINKSGGTEGVGQDYLAFAGSAHPLVTAAHNAGGDEVTFTVLTRGEIGNINITTDEASITVTDPSGGVDGTVGAKGDIRIDADAIYVCTAANTSTGQNWKRATLGALA